MTPPNLPGEWVLVPREPTYEMIYALECGLTGPDVYGDRKATLISNWLPSYQTMLAAAPLPPAISEADMREAFEKYAMQKIGFSDSIIACSRSDKDYSAYSDTLNDMYNMWQSAWKAALAQIGGK